MALTEAYAAAAVTVSTTEYSLPANSTTLATLTDTGVFQLFLDCSAMTATERYALKLYEKAGASATKRVFQTVILVGPLADPIYVTPAFALLDGWDMTLDKLQGTDRAFSWSIRKAA